MSPNASSEPNASPSDLGTKGLSGKPANSLKPDSLKAARLKMTEYWTKKTIPLAIAISILPIVGIGAVTYGVGQSTIGQASSSQEASEFKSSAKQSLLLLLLGTGATALLAGGLSWLWLKVFINALIKQSTQLVNQADQFEISESLQDFGYTIGLLQEQPHTQDILDTAAQEVRSLLKADRILVFFNGNHQFPAMQSEATASGQSSLLQADLSKLPLSLEDLFKVPKGYVQVCAEVTGSDLSATHQKTLKQLKVQAQMVTQITLDNQSKGILVAQQCSAPRDWTEVEHQLFAAIAKQIGIALERQTSPNTSSSPATGNGELQKLWSDYRNHCFELSQTARTQGEGLNTLVSQSQTRLDRSQIATQGLQQTQEQIQAQPELLQASETAVSRSISSMTETQATLTQTSQSSEQLIDFGRTMAEIASQIKAISDQVNYQAMNASITAKKQSADQSWSLDFTNQILKMTRELGRHTSELESLASKTASESQTIASAVDTGNEQMLISAEWLKESRQQLNQLVTMNHQIQATLTRLIDSNQEEHRLLTMAHPQLIDLSQWLNQTVEQSEAILQSLDQGSQRALA